MLQCTLFSGTNCTNPNSQNIKKIISHTPQIQAQNNARITPSTFLTKK